MCLAPLTNIALAFKIDPSVTGKLKDMVIMGGNSEGVGNTTMAAEFNFYADPEAAFVVLNKAACPLFVVTWELCFKYVDMPMVSSVNAACAPFKVTSASRFPGMETKRPWQRRHSPSPFVQSSGGGLVPELAVRSRSVDLVRPVCHGRGSGQESDQGTKEKDGKSSHEVLIRPQLLEKRLFQATVELSGIHSRGSMILENRLIMERSAAFRSNVILVDKLDEEAVSQMLLDAFKHHF